MFATLFGTLVGFMSDEIHFLKVILTDVKRLLAPNRPEYDHSALFVREWSNSFAIHEALMRKNARRRQCDKITCNDNDIIQI
jgi:hypothetical protein